MKYSDLLKTSNYTIPAYHSMRNKVEYWDVDDRDREFKELHDHEQEDESIVCFHVRSASHQVLHFEADDELVLCDKDEENVSLFQIISFTQAECGSHGLLWCNSSA
jgi:hypothetical protein